MRDQRRNLLVDAKVLITGESGSGKELVAQAIHNESSRADKAFVAVNCAGLPETLLESELFGHVRGSFTGAYRDKLGKLEMADSGTVFLDEIGEMTLRMQGLLLRFLETGELQKVGADHVTRRVNVRVVAATNRNLRDMIGQGLFREDLFYRLNVVPLHVPPLRERRVEIPALATHYLQKWAHENGKGDLRIAEETMEYLVLYRWPGNVRQLANEMRRMAALAESGAVLMPEHLSPDIAASRRTIPASERALEPTEIVSASISRWRPPSSTSNRR
jgi:transcriptional regulator with GAF, ATPase, and Fis domain